MQSNFNKHVPIHFNLVNLRRQRCGVMQEMQQCRAFNLRSEEDMAKRHSLEQKRLPKILKEEMKTRLLVFKESLRITQTNSSPEQDRDKIRQVRRNTLSSDFTHNKKKYYTVLFYFSLRNVSK